LKSRLRIARPHADPSLQPRPCLTTQDDAQTKLEMPAAFVYILSNKTRTTLYVGVTTNLPTRMWEHRTQRHPNSFSARYKLFHLIYFERFDLITDAIAREKYIKGKTRKWKENLIATKNPDWVDLDSFTTP
jgi:putative endonuclease